MFSRCEEKGAIARLTGDRGESSFFPTKESEATALIKNSTGKSKMFLFNIKSNKSYIERVTN